MKKLLLLAALALGAAAIGTSVASATGNVVRYQIHGATFNVTEPYGAVGQWVNVWTHTYTVTFDNPCGVNTTGAFTGTGIPQTGPGGVTEPGVTGETITGTLSDTTISYTATRSDGRTWTLTNAPYNTVVLAATSPPVSWDIDMNVSQPTLTESDYKNHGDYVSQTGGSDAAHSCIGMPIQSNQ